MPGLAHRLEVEERGVIGDARRLLHVVRHNHNRVVLLEFLDQVFHRKRRDRAREGPDFLYRDVAYAGVPHNVVRLFTVRSPELVFGTITRFYAGSVMHNQMKSDGFVDVLKREHTAQRNPSIHASTAVCWDDAPAPAYSPVSDATPSFVADVLSEAAVLSPQAAREATGHLEYFADTTTMFNNPQNEEAERYVSGRFG